MALRRRNKDEVSTLQPADAARLRRTHKNLTRVRDDLADIHQELEDAIALTSAALERLERTIPNDS